MRLDRALLRQPLIHPMTTHRRQACWPRCQLAHPFQRLLEPRAAHDVVPCPGPLAPSPKVVNLAPKSAAESQPTHTHTRKCRCAECRARQARCWGGTGDACARLLEPAARAVMRRRSLPEKSRRETPLGTTCVGLSVRPRVRSCPRVRGRTVLGLACTHACSDG